MLIVVAVQMVILGAVASLYLFTVQQCGQATAAVGPTQQANGAMDAIRSTVRESMDCTIVSAGGTSGLRCTLPANALDTDGDGVNDAWMPTKFSSSGKASYTKGLRVWYYLGSSTGAFTPGTTLWRATRTDDANPTAANADQAWSLYYGGKSRYPLIDTLAFSVSATTALATVTITASASARKPEGSGATATAQDKQSASLTQAMAWRTDFE